MTVDQVPLEHCFGPGVWLDLSHKGAGEDIGVKEMEEAANANPILDTARRYRFNTYWRKSHLRTGLL